MQPNIGYSEKHLTEISQVLSVVLADEFVLYTKNRNAHWNIEGPDFYSLHGMFEEQYDELVEIVDKVAERMRMLGHYAPCSIQKFMERTTIKEHSAELHTSKACIEDLPVSHEAVIINLRTQIDRLPSN